jgi:hypothetical protein
MKARDGLFSASPIIEMQKRCVMRSWVGGCTRIFGDQRIIERRNDFAVVAGQAPAPPRGRSGQATSARRNNAGVDAPTSTAHIGCDL